MRKDLNNINARLYESKVAELKTYLVSYPIGMKWIIERMKEFDRYKFN